MFESMTTKDGRTYEAMVLGLLKVFREKGVMLIVLVFLIVLIFNNLS